MELKPFVDRLSRILPQGWNLALADAPTPLSRIWGDAQLTLSAPDGPTADLLLEAKSRVSARQAAAIGAQWGSVRQSGSKDLAGAMVFTRFASKMARTRFREAGVSYLDLTGNIWLAINSPAVFIDQQGAETDPDPPGRGVRSLKGAQVARIVRGLCDWKPPVGVRQLADRAGVSPSYASRVLALLEDEDVVVRTDQGEVSDVRWQDLLRRWSQDYSTRNSNRVVSCLAPRGLSQARERLGSYSGQYALTGSSAVPPEAQITPAPLLSCYVANPELAAKELDLRPTDAGVNVLLVEPFDSIVFERTREDRGIRSVALTQLVVDLLTGSGREPAQAEALVSWMEENEGVWRA